MTWIVFFDGECALCSSSVQFLAQADHLERLKFSPLQGKTAASWGFSDFAALDDGSVVILREADGKNFLRSDAIIELGNALGGFWRLLWLGHLIPRPAREALYRFIAKNRINWFGHAQHCAMPDPSLLSRMLP